MIFDFRDICLDSDTIDHGRYMIKKLVGTNQNVMILHYCSIVCGLTNSYLILQHGRHLIKYKNRWNIHVWLP